MKDEIVNQLQLPENVSHALTPAFVQFQQALRQANEESGINDLDQQVVLEIAKRFIWNQNGQSEGMLEELGDIQDHNIN